MALRRTIMASQELFRNLRVLVTGFGFGILLMVVVQLWGDMLIPYKIFAIGLLAFTLYSLYLFTRSQEGLESNSRLVCE